MAITRLGQFGFGTRRTGSFAGKTSTAAIIVDAVIEATSAGIRKRPVRVRRADFSTQENYELALKMALQGSQYAIREEIAAPVIPKKKPAKVAQDTVIKVSAESLLALQAAAEMDEIELIKTFIRAIESEYE